MEYKLIIILILLVTIYALYYTKKNTEWIIALSLLLILVINELLKKKNESFSGSVEIPSYEGIISLLNNQGEKLDNVDYLLDLVEKVIRSKYSDRQNLRYKAIPINNSCVLT